MSDPAEVAAIKILHRYSKGMGFNHKAAENTIRKTYAPQTEAIRALVKAVEEDALNREGEDENYKFIEVLDALAALEAECPHLDPDTASTRPDCAPESDAPSPE